MKRIYDINLLHDMLIDSHDKIEGETDFPLYYWEALGKGFQNLSQDLYISSKKFDDMWIKTVESYFPSLDKITRNLKSVLRYDEELVIVEKAKKTTRRAVEHLSSNAQYIKEVTPKGIIPKKILTSQSEIEYGIYENRFVKTLINRLEKFIKERLDVIKESLHTKRETKLKYESKFEIEDNTFDVKVDISQKDAIFLQEEDEHNQRIYNRALKLHNLISAIKMSQFMKLMKPYKEVSSPVMKTQIILKNSDFNNAYVLWIFLEQYHQLGYVLDTKEEQRVIEPSYLKQMAQVSLMGLTTLLTHSSGEEKSSDKIKRRVERSVPKILAPDELKAVLYDTELSPQTINEYYLAKSKELFEAQIETTYDTAHTYEMALKEVLTATLEITNSLYASYFQINTQASDMFNRLIQKKDPKTDYQTALKRYEIAKIIREVKESDYKNSIELEKKWQEQVLFYGNIMLEQAKKDETLFTQKLIDEIKAQTNDLLQEEKQKLDVVKKNNIVKYKSDLKTKQKVAKAKIDRALKLFKEKEKQKRIKAKKQEKQKLQKQKDKMRKQKLLLQEKQKAQHALKVKKLNDQTNEKLSKINK